LAERSFKERVAPQTLVGQKAENGVKFTTEMAEHVDFYIETIMRDAAEADANMADIVVEKKFHLVDVDESAFGTCDAHFGQTFGKLYVYDLKYGAGVPVGAVNNLQLMYYALGAAQDGDYDEVELVIVQPRTSDPVKRWVIPMATLDEFKNLLIDAIARTREKDAALVDGPHCKWCPALAVCPQVRKNVLEVAQQDFKESKPLPNPGELTLPQLKQVLDKAELIEDWLASVQVHAKTLIEAGSVIEGWKLVPKRAHRKWKDEFEVETELSEFGAAIYERKLKTPKQMEAVAGKEKVS
jgi:hypothetical protein